MPFNLRRATSYKPAWQIAVGEWVGNLDVSSQVEEVTREGDRVRLVLRDGRVHELEANESVPVVSRK